MKKAFCFTILVGLVLGSVGMAAAGTVEDRAVIDEVMASVREVGLDKYSVRRLILHGVKEEKIAKALSAFLRDVQDSSSEKVEVPEFRFTKSDFNVCDKILTSMASLEYSKRAISEIKVELDSPSQILSDKKRKKLQRLFLNAGKMCDSARLIYLEKKFPFDYANVVVMSLRNSFPLKEPNPNFWEKVLKESKEWGQ